MWSRREFIQLTATGVPALMTTDALAQNAPKAPRRPIDNALQLYTLRQTAGADLPGTFAALKKQGYAAVEFAGYYNQDAKTLRKLLDDHGLRCCGTHIQLRALQGDELPKTIEFNQALGNPNLVVASLGNATPKTLEGWSAMAETFADIAGRAKPSKMRIGFHNHTEEFTPIDGQIPFKYFFQKAGPDVYVQVDTGSAARAGVDPVALIEKFDRRVISLHLRDHDPAKPDAPFGTGVVRWRELFRAAERNTSIDWYIMEHGAGMDQTTQAFENFKALRVKYY
jgi:sugar phosphate isomerase/epimerase